MFLPANITYVLNSKPSSVSCFPGMQLSNLVIISYFINFFSRYAALLPNDHILRGCAVAPERFAVQGGADGEWGGEDEPE